MTKESKSNIATGKTKEDLKKGYRYDNLFAGLGSILGGVILLSLWHSHIVSLIVGIIPIITGIKIMSKPVSVPEPVKGEDVVKQITLNYKNIGKDVEIEGNAVHIKGNIKIGDMITINNKGKKGSHGGENGDLIYVIVNIK